MNPKAAGSLIVATLMGTVVGSLGVGASAHAAPTTTSTRVIVVAEPGRVGDAQRQLAALGGTVGRSLSIIGGFAGSLAADRVSHLENSSAVASVSADAVVTPKAVDPALGYDSAETSSLSSISRITGAQSLWNAGFAGQGVDVAVIDTGVTRVPGLDRVGKVVDGPDLSFDSIEPTLVSQDAFGHGTHMAGIIAGSDVAPGTSAKGCTTCLGKSAYTNTTKFVGIAPEARIVNVKVGAFDGATDVSQVIAGIDWVVQHRKDSGLNIRVLNLSFGTDSVQGASIDPLVHAVEVAWRAGIVVVVAAGNDGLLTTSLSNPAISPSVIAVGASDPVGTLSVADDYVPAFAQHGSTTRGVDLVAPGVSVLGLRVPGSFVDQNVATGKVGTRFQRATGTSQSTAVASGLAALLISKYPTASPDVIKSYLKTSAQPLLLVDPALATKFRLSPAVVAMINSWYAGSGSANVAGAATLPKLPAVATVTPAGTGLGSLGAARGTSYVTNGTSTLTGERDIFGSAWNAKSMAAATETMTAWTGGTWNGIRWSGDSWAGIRWSNVTWTSLDWSGIRWSGARWSSMAWDGARWSGARWSGARWSSGSWTGARWSGARWSDNGWN